MSDTLPPGISRPDRLVVRRGTTVVELVGMYPRAGGACVDHERILDKGVVGVLRLGAVDSLRGVWVRFMRVDSRRERGSVVVVVRWWFLREGRQL